MGICEIARICGTSPSTVSRVLSGRWEKCAKEGLRERIWQEARRQGYQPSVAARALRSGVAPAAGPCLAILRARQDSPCFFKLLAQAADAELLNIGGALGPHGTAAHANAALLSGADGAVVLGRCKPALLEKLQKLEIPIVCTGLNRVDAPVDQVLCDGRAIASEATEHLLRMGHHQIGYVGESRRESRFLGYRRALLEQGICTRPELVFEAPLTEEGGFCAAKRVAATLPQVTAFFCANDAVGIGLLRGLKELVPTRPLPALLSVDNTGSANVAHPLLSTVDIPVREMGRVAVRLLADRLAGGHVLPQTVFLPYSFLWRESCQKK